jgi:hypothetical protein
MAKGAARAGIWGLAPAQSTEEQAAAAGTSLPGEAGDAGEAFPPGAPLVLSAPPAVMTAADAGFTRQFPAMIAHGQASGRRRLGPVWHATPAAETRPMAAVPGDTLGRPEVLFLRRVRDGIQDLDFAALDAAREQEGATHASARQARGAVPLHDEVLLAGRPPQDRPPVAAAARRRISALAYPPCDGSATRAAYAELLRRVSVITGTTGTGTWPLPALRGAR